MRQLRALYTELFYLPARAAIICVRIYQFGISPLKRGLMGPTAGCRFHPSCSHYAVEALRQHGFLKGSYLAIHRILRCHPFNAGGHDPVPKSTSSQCCCHFTEDQSTAPKPE